MSGYQLAENISLAGRNTFRVPARAAMMADVHRAEVLDELFGFAALRDGPVLVIGEGSNLLFVDDFPGVAICLAMAGCRIVRDDGDSAVVRAEAGMNWNDLVAWTLGRGLCGLENLALIPGTVGAAPIQNIGAYGVELAERFDSLDAVDLDTGERRRFSRADCRFAYRDSVFKAPGSRRWLILSVRLVVSRELEPRLDYGDLRKTLAGAPVSARSIADAVIALRRARLPDPAVLGNAGSFFKNPVVDSATVERLRRVHPDLPAWPAGPGLAKLPAAWLIERDGWKGYRDQDAGVHDRHALVLVNHGTATGAELLALARRIRDSVQARFGVRLEPEPVVLRGADIE